MISAYGIFGRAAEAIALFEDVCASSQPNARTFASVLNACSHARLPNQALAYLQRMVAPSSKVKPTVEHWTCVVDSLSRVGRLEEAEKIISRVPKEEITAVPWMALLGGCRWYSDFDRAAHAAEQVRLITSPDDKDTLIAMCVLLANMCASCGRFELAQQLHEEIQGLGLKKIPGKSWIEIDGHQHTFIAHDRTHPRSAEIFAELSKLRDELKGTGYIPDTASVLHPLEEAEKELHLCFHSEKLAIAFGLIATPPGTPLLICKNLRVCPDCHNATARISQLRNRTIVVRDANRFHEFQDGKCSCNNLW